MSRTKEIPPLVIPPGVRLVLRLADGSELPVVLFKRRPVCAIGECPQRPPAPRRRADESPGLFDAVPGAEAPRVEREPAAVIVVYAATRPDLDKAYAVHNHPDLRPYATEVRTDPATRGA